VAYFATCRRLREDSDENRRAAAAYVERVQEQLPAIRPVAVGLFAGKLDLASFSLPMQLAMRLSRTPTGDWRDWRAIRAWAEGLALAF